VTLTAATLAVGCGRRLDDAECHDLLDHYTALLAREEDPDVSPAHIAELQTKARAVARNEKRFDFAACPSRVSRNEYECAIAAPSVDAVERCLVF